MVNQGSTILERTFRTSHACFKVQVTEIAGSQSTSSTFPAQLASLGPLAHRLAWHGHGPQCRADVAGVCAVMARLEMNFAKTAGVLFRIPSRGAYGAPSTCTIPLAVASQSCCGLHRPERERGRCPELTSHSLFPREKERSYPFRLCLIRHRRGDEGRSGQRCAICSGPRCV